MCIALLSNAHPLYSLILIDNRDEYLNRPTAPASWWPEPYSKVFGGRDLLRSDQGTWLGVTKEGRVAVLTNFREDAPPPTQPVSRGAIIRGFLTGDHRSTANFVQETLASTVGKDVGGFSLVCGRVGKSLAVISNRAASESQVPWIMSDGHETVGLSNAAFGNQGWDKVSSGEKMLADAIRASIEESEDEEGFVKRLLAILSTDTLPHNDTGGDLASQLPQLRNTIFVPAVGEETSEGQIGTSGKYGTKQQTIVLVGRDQKVRYFERTLYDDYGDPVPISKGDIDVQFDIQRSS